MDIFNETPEAAAFPQEIFDIIIDSLHDDPKALRACSLVCQSWLPSSSFHMFPRTICLPPRKMRRKNWTAKTSLKTFITPRVVRYAQELILTGFADDKVLSCSLVEVFEALDQIPNLRSLTVDLENVQITCPSSNPLPHASFSHVEMSHIDTLVISGACNPDFPLMLALIQRFHHISLLTLSNSILSVPSNHFQMRRKSRVDAIQFYQCFGRQVFALVVDCVDTERLLSIVVGGERDGNNSSLAAFVARTPNVEHLTYALFTGTSSARLGRVPPRLQSVAIRQNWDVSFGYTNDSYWSQIIYALASCPATVTSVTIRLDIVDILVRLHFTHVDVIFSHTIAPMNWIALGAKLSRFPSLNVLRVVLRDQTTVRPAKEWSYGTFKLMVSNHMADMLPSHLQRISSVEAEWDVVDRGVTG